MTDIARVEAPGRSLDPETVAAMVQLLKKHGCVYITGAPEGFDYPTELGRLGVPIPQYQGELVRDIRPDPDLGVGTYSALSMDELNPHTEWYEFAGIPPRYVALWGVRAAAGGGGETTLADGYGLLEEFSEADRDQLHHRVYEWYGLPATNGGAPLDPVLHPVLEHHPDGLILRFSSKYVQRLDDGLIPRYIDVGRQYFHDHHVAIAIATHDVLVWDNWRMLHARNSFTDPRRHLRRMLLAAL